MCLETRVIMRVILGVTILVGCLFSSQAKSTEIPKYDANSWCNKVAHSVGGYSEMIMAGCLSEEQESYDTLSVSWSSLPDHTRDWCDKVARSSGNGSYTILSGCVQMEIDAGKSKPRFHY